MYTELLMYTAPDCVREANEAWIERTLQLLGQPRSHWHGNDLLRLWRHPQLLLAQTCGYPLVTQLQGQVRLVGRPRYALPDSNDGWHCSLLVVRRDEARASLRELRGCRGVLNGFDSNSGMNLLRHRLAPWQQNGRFFSSLQISGSHRESIARIADGTADLAAIDSVTFAYLQRHAPNEISGVRVLERTARSPTLPYITAASGIPADSIRAAMNQALDERPQVATILALQSVEQASVEDYAVLLGYRDEAAAQGFATLA